MLFGDIFAAFVLHQNGGQNRQALLAATQAVAATGPIGGESGVTHVGDCSKIGHQGGHTLHMIDAGYLALLLL